MAVETKPRVAALPPVLPPGPQTGRLTQAVAFHRDPLGFLSDCRERFGDLFMIHMAVTGPMMVVADPGAIDAIVGAPDGGAARRRILGMVSPRSILGADGAQHGQARGRIEGAFTDQALAPLAGAMTEIADRHAATWPARRPFRLLPRMRALLDEIFVRLVLGVRGEQRARELTGAIGRMIYTPGNPPFPPPGDGNGLLGGAAKRLFERRSAPVARLLAEEIESRRAAGDQRHDAIGCMLRLPTPDAVDQLIPLLMAGQEPPAAGLTWLLDRLAREPGAAERFREAPDDTQSRAFVRETLRITPAVHSVVRRLEGGLVAAVPIVLIHHDARAFPEPDRFDPARFGDDPDSEGVDLPFGGGPRRCLGEQLAHIEIANVLPAILRRHHLTPVSSRPERMVVRGTVLVPQRSGLVLSR